MNPRFPPCSSKHSKGDQDICNNGAASPPFTGRWLLAMLLFKMLRYSINMHQYTYQCIVSVFYTHYIFGIQCIPRSNKPVTIFKILPNISLPSACFRHSLTIPQAATAVIHRSARGQARPRIHWMPWLRTPGFFWGMIRKYYSGAHIWH